MAKGDKLTNTNIKIGAKLIDSDDATNTIEIISFKSVQFKRNKKEFLYDKKGKETINETPDDFELGAFLGKTKDGKTHEYYPYNMDYDRWIIDVEGSGQPITKVSDEKVSVPKGKRQ